MSRVAGVFECMNERRACSDEYIEHRGKHRNVEEVDVKIFHSLYWSGSISCSDDDLGDTTQCIFICYIIATQRPTYSHPRLGL